MTPILALIALALALALGCARPPAATAPPPGAAATPSPFSRDLPPLEMGGPAPSFRLETLDGSPIGLAAMAGQVVVLNFWASWCGPCRQEMPAFQQAWEEHRDRGVVFVGVAVDDTATQAGDFARQVGVTYPLALDITGEVAQAYRLQALPSTFFIDRQGNLVSSLSGLANQGALRIFLRGQLGKGQ